LLSSLHDLADHESTQGQSTRLWASHRLAENTKSLEIVPAGLSCRQNGGAHLDTTTGNLFLPRPARNERGEGRGEGHPVEWASSPQPSPPVGEERELISSGCLVVVTRCAPEREQLRRPRDHRRAHLGTTTKSARKRSAAVCGAPFEHYDYLVFMFPEGDHRLRRDEGCAKGLLRVACRALPSSDDSVGDR